MTSDSILINNLRKGHKKSFETVFRLYYVDLHNFAYSFVMNKQIGEDIVQDVFFNLWLNRKNIPTIKNLKSYLFTSVKNACNDYFRHLKVIDKNRNKLTEAIIYSKTVNYEDNNEILDKVQTCINKLSERQQQIIKLKLLGLKYNEIAIKLEISEHSVHTHIKRIYKIFRNNFPILLIISPIIISKFIQK